jgi:hypothetical protein
MLKKAIIVVVAVLLLTGIGLQAMASSSTSPVAVSSPAPTHGIDSSLKNLPIISRLPIFNHNASASIRPTVDPAVTSARLGLVRTTAANSINSIVAALNMVNNRVASSKLSAGDKATMTSQIDANITWFQAEQSSIQSASDVNTIRTDVSQITAQWNSIKTSIKQETGILACDELDARLSNASRAASIASQKIQSLSAEGKDTSALQSALASYNSNLATATTDSQNARADFNDITSSSNANANYAAGLSQLNQAQQQLSAGYQNLITMYRLFLNNATTNSLNS